MPRILPGCRLSLIAGWLGLLSPAGGAALAGPPEPASGELAGQVIGTDGRPVADAEVFNQGDGRERVATITDSRGRFRLEGLFRGPKYAFVRKPGYRFTGARSEGDADGLTITLRKVAEPPAAWQPARGPGLDEQRAFARQILVRMWDQHAALALSDDVSACIERMARIDPDLAGRWSASKGHGYDDVVRRIEARRLAETDPAGAIALLDREPDAKSQMVLQELADRFAGTDAEKALRFADEAAARARRLDQPERSPAMGNAGAVLVKLGRSDAGRKLIDEAAREAGDLPIGRWEFMCRWETARAIAAHEPDRALALIEPLRADPDQEWWQSGRARIAVAIAATDPRRAIALVETVRSTGFEREKARTAIAYRIGGERPDEAIRLIEGIKHSRWDAHWKAEAFGWLAVALAPRDRARAHALIDRALAMMVDHRDPEGPTSELAAAARIASCARRIDYPDMQGAILRVLATRPGDLRGGGEDREYLIGWTTNAAKHLAVVDPGAARAVLEQIEARAGFDPVTDWRTRPPWLLAWGLVDLAKARAILDPALAALRREDEGSRRARKLVDPEILELVDLLTASPDRREAVMETQTAGGHWRPDVP